MKPKLRIVTLSLSLTGVDTNFFFLNRYGTEPPSLTGAEMNLLHE